MVEVLEKLHNALRKRFSNNKRISWRLQAWITFFFLGFAVRLSKHMASRWMLTIAPQARLSSGEEETSQMEERENDKSNKQHQEETPVLTTGAADIFALGSSFPAESVLDPRESNLKPKQERLTITAKQEPVPSMPSIVPWVPNDLRVACQFCKKEYGMFFRRHHCRFCGEVVCGDDSVAGEYTPQNPEGLRWCIRCQKTPPNTRALPPSESTNSLGGSTWSTRVDEE
eukprot:gb/GEZN01018858.1/.p1 GENE.gb/GEZN01018858.1/~~gb/GEZN01018858.1/.p1  ORF type:complete len:228 (-),score=20.80 gb/GEZN01018858.1/:34-717(-)